MVRVSLLNMSEFLEFKGLTLENIIHKNGRRLFPQPKFSVTDLDPQENYRLSLGFKQVCCMTFLENKWHKATSNTKKLEDRAVNHVFGVTTGSRLMEAQIEFQSLKITNNDAIVNDNIILLNSKHQYIPILIVQRMQKIGSNWQVQESESFQFEETAFVTTTRYMGREQADKKIAMNSHSCTKEPKRKLTAGSEENEQPWKKVKPSASRDDSGFDSSANSPFSVIPMNHWQPPVFDAVTVPNGYPSASQMHYQPSMTNTFYPSDHYPVAPVHPSTYYQPMEPPQQYYYHNDHYPYYY